MGFFRRYKLSDYTAEECRKGIDHIAHQILLELEDLTLKDLEGLMEDWACFRELLARHEGKNKSQLDE
tara:strand:- start:968 stop:1171 length:204 start_codon:yes stop_codon:yes gene_type:complete